MTTSTTMTPGPVTTGDLEAAGLTTLEVARLIYTRKHYNPFREHFSESEYQRLNFLRWQIEHGRVGRD